MLLVRLVLLPFRLVVKTTRAATKLGYRTGRLFGYRRLFVFGAGVAVGLLTAPSSGAELRARLRELLVPAPAEPAARTSQGAAAPAATGTAAIP